MRARIWGCEHQKLHCALVLIHHEGPVRYRNQSRDLVCGVCVCAKKQHRALVLIYYECPARVTIDKDVCV
jgi:hypothetical protein